MPRLPKGKNANAPLKPKTEIRENPQEQDPATIIPKVVTPPTVNDNFPPAFLRFFKVLYKRRIFAPTRRDEKIRIIKSLSPNAERAPIINSFNRINL